MKHYTKNTGIGKWKMETRGFAENITYTVVLYSKIFYWLVTTYRYQENKTGNRSWGNPITECPTPKPQVSSSPRYAATVGGHSPP
jgi:hypothetical protein